MRCRLRYRLRRRSMMRLLLRSGSRHQYGWRVAGRRMRSRGCSLTVPTLGMASNGRLSKAPILEMCCGGEGGYAGVGCASRFKSQSPSPAAALAPAEAMTCRLSQCGNSRIILPRIPPQPIITVSLIHTFSADLMSHCIRSSIARQLFRSSKKTPFLTINRSFTYASPKMDPVSTGLNSVPITNGEGKPALRYVDVGGTPSPDHYLS